MTIPMTVSNRMTVLRGIASLVYIPIIIVDDPFYRVFALLIFVIAAFTDYYDGRLARQLKEKTDFGVIADPVADKLLTAVGLISASWLIPDIVPAWMTGVILVREVIITTFRFVALARGRIIGADRWGKWKTGLQMTVIPYALVFATIFTGEHGRVWESLARASIVGDIIFNLGFLLSLVTTILTLYSGMLILRAPIRSS